MFHNMCVPEYKGYLIKYFYDIDGTSGMYKQYYPNGILEKECYHNSDIYMKANILHIMRMEKLKKLQHILMVYVSEKI